jgi:hypothetical protein
MSCGFWAVFTGLQVFPLYERIENINDQYWILRTEEVLIFIYKFIWIQNNLWNVKINIVILWETYLQIPEEEKDLGPQDRVIHVYHFTWDTAENQMVWIVSARHLYMWLSRYSVVEFIYMLVIIRYKILVSPSS